MTIPIIIDETTGWMLVLGAVCFMIIRRMWR